MYIHICIHVLLTKSIDIHQEFHHSFFQRFHPEFHSQHLRVTVLGHSAIRDTDHEKIFKTWPNNKNC